MSFSLQSSQICCKKPKATECFLNLHHSPSSCPRTIFLGYQGHLWQKHVSPLFCPCCFNEYLGLFKETWQFLDLNLCCEVAVQNNFSSSSSSSSSSSYSSSSQLGDTQQHGQRWLHWLIPAAKSGWEQDCSFLAPSRGSELPGSLGKEIKKDLGLGPDLWCSAGQKRDRQKEHQRKAILYQCKSIHFKYPFYYIICIVILIIDLVGSSNEAREYKVSNKVNCCL